MTKSDIPEIEHEVLADVWPAFRLFEALSTQWRVGMGGPVGLDYGAIPSTGSMLGMKRKEITAAFHDVRVMEAEALLIMSQSK
ncbi:DUF1799 domain-containing protein [Pseudomonas sp. LP_7_YM]|uniref:DUF1799 domain-containing protein n=1 Tax=Pseudomonas sp. LP_7_YM TaxID=2485137 RepID=UPI00105C2F44|nr:DUF1799 domain-containing protein [Pseudomonas sp. LP_7_YM]TDV70192.1 uncharacterized protein DUF1799 [Pseudomonas sp. LP_7_YM]